MQYDGFWTSIMVIQSTALNTFDYDLNMVFNMPKSAIVLPSDTHHIVHSTESYELN